MTVAWKGATYLTHETTTRMIELLPSLKHGVAIGPMPAAHAYGRGDETPQNVFEECSLLAHRVHNALHTQRTEAYTHPDKCSSLSTMKSQKYKHDTHPFPPLWTPVPPRHRARTRRDFNHSIVRDAGLAGFVYEDIGRFERTVGYSVLYSHHAKSSQYE